VSRLFWNEVIGIEMFFFAESFFEVFRVFAIEKESLFLILLHAPIIKLNNI